MPFPLRAFQSRLAGERAALLMDSISQQTARFMHSWWLLAKSVGLHPNVGLSLMPSDVQTHQSVQIKYIGFNWADLTRPVLRTALCHFNPDVPIHKV